MTSETQIRETLGKRLRQARRRRSMTLQEVAERSGVKFQQISKYEIGSNTLSVPRLLMLGRALGVSASDLIGGLD